MAISNITIFYSAESSNTFYEFLKKYFPEFNCSYFISKSKNIKTIHKEIPVYEITDKGIDKSTPIIIPTLTDFNEIKTLLTSNGWLNIYSYIEFLEENTPAEIQKKLLPFLDSKTQSIVLNLPEPNVYWKHFGTLPQKLLKENYTVLVCAKNKEIEETQPFGSECSHLALDFHFLEFYLIKHADLIISDNHIRKDFTEYFNSKKIAYLPHGTVGLIDRFIDMKMSEDKVLETFSVHMLNLFNYFFIPNEPLFRLYKATANKLGKSTHSKHLIPTGYISLDKSIKEHKTDKTPKDAILYSPGAIPKENFCDNKFASFPYHSNDIIQPLLDNFPNHKIIFRPHPASSTHPEFKDKLKEIINRFISHNNFEYDAAPTHTKSFSRACFVISDSSTSAFTFSFSTLRPVIFYQAQGTSSHHYLFGEKYESPRSYIGVIVSNIDQLLHHSNKFLATPHIFSKEILDFRNKYYFNVGNVENKCIEYIKSILSDKHENSWSIH